MTSDDDDVGEVREAKHPYGEQDAWGNSVDSLRANLKLTPTERLRKAERAARAALRLRNAAKRIR
ncbi:MAG: hypothetical protein JST30_17325 [Armatimonadetes bacterium]|nr:hypothetical protein [Armatimonadota bacterium]